MSNSKAHKILPIVGAVASAAALLPMAVVVLAIRAVTALATGVVTVAARVRHH